MSNENEIITIAGKRVSVKHTTAFWCDECCLGDVISCYPKGPCEEYNRDGLHAYFVPAREETHTLQEWAQILATNPDLRAEFDKLCPPPIQGSIAPEADLEAEIERWWNERYAKVDKNYKFDSTRGHYLDNETIIDLARNFAEWERARIEPELRLAWGKISKDPFDVDSVFKELLEHLKR